MNLSLIMVDTDQGCLFCRRLNLEVHISFFTLLLLLLSIDVNSITLQIAIGIVFFICTYNFLSGFIFVRYFCKHVKLGSGATRIFLTLSQGNVREIRFIYWL